MPRSLTVKWKVFLMETHHSHMHHHSTFFSWRVCFSQHSICIMKCDILSRSSCYFSFLPSLCWSSICLKTPTISSGLGPTLLCRCSSLNSHSLYTMYDCCFPCCNWTYNGAATLSDISLSQALQQIGLVVHAVETGWAASFSPIRNSGILFFFIRLKVGRRWIHLAKRRAWILT